MIGLGLGNRVTTLMLDDWSSSRLRLYDLILIDNHNTPELFFLPFLEKFTHVARITRHVYVDNCLIGFLVYTSRQSTFPENIKPYTLHL